MQIPQPRPYAEAKKSTHDFLSLYSDPSSFHQHPDPSPPPSQGMYLKTHDFLQVSKSNTISEATNEMPTAEKPQSVEHVLPGGIGTYTISHIPNHGTVKPERNVCSVAHPSVNERKVEPRKATNGCSPFNGAFTLWEESAVKEKVGEQFRRAEPAEKLGQLLSSEGPSPPLAGGGFAVSLPSSKQQKSRGFMDMIRSSKGGPEEDDDDEEEFMKKDGSSQRGDGGGKGDAKGGDPKVATPRSKHSATEQRRRSKINDRFQILRELIPNSDQKRDKASFLLEVIEYIQFLQEKVHKYESSYPGWNQEGAKKLVPWKHSPGLGEGMPDHPHLMKNGPIGGILSGRKFDDNSVAVPPAVVAAAHQFIESVNAGAGVPHHHPGLAGKVVSVPLQQQQQQQGIPSPFVRSGGGLAQVPQRSMSDVENTTPQWHRPCTTDGDNNVTEQEEMTIEGGTIRISSVYSRGLMSSLTHALQNSGIDLSQASVSVQIDLGKRALRSSGKDQEEPSSSNRAMTHSRAASSGEDSDPAQKRPRFDSS